MKLWPQQESLKQDIYREWSTGAKNVCAVSPTGTGKTVLFSAITHEHVGASVSIAHRQELVGQMSIALARESVPHNIIAPKNVRNEIIQVQTYLLGRNWYDPAAKTTVAGVRTLNSRAASLEKWRKSISLWITDECHHLLRDNEWGKAAAMFPNAKGLGVTATPTRTDGKGLGRNSDGVFDVMVEGPTMRWSINNGFLTDYRIFAPPSDLIVEGKPGKSGDWSTPQLKAASKNSKIVGDVVEHYIRLACDKMGVVFVTDIDTANETAAAFNTAGIVAAAVSSNNTNKERTQIIRDFKAHKIQTLVNVDIFGEGFDLPAIEVVSFARPTMSLALYIQQFGRALRVMVSPELQKIWGTLSTEERLYHIANSVKQTAIIIDHVGNTDAFRHGLPDRVHYWSLDKREKRAKGAHDPDIIPTRACTSCTALYEAIFKVCPYCKAPHIPAGRGSPALVDGDLIELDAATLAAMRGEIDWVDRPVADLRVHMEQRGRPWSIIQKQSTLHQLRQRAQTNLRDVIAYWAGHQRAAGHPDSESYRRFYFRYGVDVMTAQALKTDDAKDLTARIGLDLAMGKI